MITWPRIFVAILITLLNWAVTLEEVKTGGNGVRYYSNIGHK